MLRCGSGPEQPFDLLDLPAVGHKKNQVVLSLNDRIVMCFQYIIAAHDDIDRGAFGQGDFLDPAPDDARAPSIAAGNGLDGLGPAAPQ